MKAYLTDSFKEELTLQLKALDAKRYDQDVPIADKLEESIRDIIFAVNVNQNINTLCSTKMERGAGSISYLHVSFSATIEKEIEEQLLPYFYLEYNQENDYFESFLMREGSKCTGGINWSSNFPHLHTFSLVLDSENPEIHDSFWTDIKDKLYCIK